MFKVLQRRSRTSPQFVTKVFFIFIYLFFKIPKEIYYKQNRQGMPKVLQNYKNG